MGGPQCGTTGGLICRETGREGGLEQDFIDVASVFKIKISTRSSKTDFSQYCYVIFQEVQSECFPSFTSVFTWETDVIARAPCSVMRGRAHSRSMQPFRGFQLCGYYQASGLYSSLTLPTGWRRSPPTECLKAFTLLWLLLHL